MEVLGRTCQEECKYVTLFTLVSALFCFAATIVHTNILLFLAPHFSYLDQVYKNALTSTATN